MNLFSRLFRVAINIDERLNRLPKFSPQDQQQMLVKSVARDAKKAAHLTLHFVLVVPFVLQIFL